MIAYLRGNVLEQNADNIILDVNGVGYEVFCSGTALSLVGAKKTDVGIYTYLQVKEDGVTLFGFSSAWEKSVFCDLISVSGVGPKMAIGILLQMSAEDVARCIATADSKKFSTVKGLGKKTAEKIILELHGKVSAEELISADAPVVKETKKAAKLSKVDDEALSALLSLGFTRSECLSAIERAKNAGALSVEDVIRVALSGM